MNAQPITLKILEDARAQAAHTLSEANGKAAGIQMDADAVQASKKLASQAQTERQAGELRDRMLRMAELDQKKAMLAVKREMIDQAFEDALARMRKMPADKKAAYMAKLVMESAQGGETLIPSEEDKAFLNEQFMASVNARLQKAGKKPIVLSGETRPIGGGFVLKQGGMEINCAFDAVLGQVRSSLEAEVAAKLFQ